MGKTVASKQRRGAKYVDPALDQVAMLDARSMLISNMLGMGWRLAAMVLVPIFVGVQIDKKLDSAPSATLAAFFIAVFGAGMLISKTYTEMSRQQALEDQKKAKRSRRKVKRSMNV